MNQLPESGSARVLRIVVTPVMIAWEAARSVLFAVFAFAERLDPFGPLAALGKRLLPWLLKLQPFVERLAESIRAAVAWLLRPAIWIVERIVPALRWIAAHVVRAWRWAVVVSAPARRAIARVYRRAVARWREIWNQVAAPFRSARQAIVQAMRRVRGSGT